MIVAVRRGVCRVAGSGLESSMISRAWLPNATHTPKELAETLKESIAGRLSER